jgi:cyclopropane fatty-acyl-phospholipid synthase-like methyltransferase
MDASTSSSSSFLASRTAGDDADDMDAYHVVGSGRMLLNVRFPNTHWMNWGLWTSGNGGSDSLWTSEIGGNDSLWTSGNGGSDSVWTSGNGGNDSLWTSGNGGNDNDDSNDNADNGDCKDDDSVGEEEDDFDGKDGAEHDVNEVHSFPAACAALARHLARAVQMSNKDTVMDVSCGCGDQTLLFAREFGADVVGIDIEASSVAIAEAKLAALNAIATSAAAITAAAIAAAAGVPAAASGGGGGVAFARCSATDLTPSVVATLADSLPSSSSSSLSSSSPSSSSSTSSSSSSSSSSPSLSSSPTSSLQRRFNVVVALDAAYHFDSRQCFLECVSRLLPPGGRYAAVDLVFPKSGSGASSSSSSSSSSPLSFADRACLRLLSAFAKVPAVNLYDADEYAHRLRALKFVDVSVQSIGRRVIPGFARHVTMQRQRLDATGIIDAAAFARFAFAASALLKLWKRGLIDVVVVTASTSAAASVHDGEAE